MITIGYSAKNMAELADYLLDMAKERRERARFTPRKADQNDLLSQAMGIEFAADLVRDTVITPEQQA
jgi:hypothetical protein